MFRLVRSLLFMVLAGLLFLFSLETLADYYTGASLQKKLNALPPENYLPEIRRLEGEGKLEEAFELAEYVCGEEDLPGREEACARKDSLRRELDSLWGSAGRALAGFVTGEGTTAAAAAGAIASDLILYGDVRDLVLQGYRSMNDEPVDPVIAALAGFGVATELVDLVDWVPAVLKAFRKMGALSARFADLVIGMGKKAVKTGRLDGAAKALAGDLSSLVGKEGLGFGRTAAVFRQVETAEDLAGLTKAAGKNADAAYLVVKTGGRTGLDLLKAADDIPHSAALLKTAAKKGDAGVTLLSSLRRGGGYRGWLLTGRYSARIVKNMKLARVSEWMKAIVTEWPAMIWILWASLLATMAVLCSKLIAFFNWTVRPSASRN